jgi:O-methyltransferase domain
MLPLPLISGTMRGLVEGYFQLKGLGPTRIKGVSEPVELGADLFQAIPPVADAYVMKHVIHDWNDEDALKILRNCRRAIPAGGTLLLIEWVLKPSNHPDIGKLLDLEHVGEPDRVESN